MLKGAVIKVAEEESGLELSMEQEEDTMTYI